jgi:hypothetical protein
MKTVNLKNTLKFSIAIVCIMAIGTTKAQTAGAGEAITTKTDTAIRLIDNKGTIKYLQSNNGITSITSTIGGSKTTTTFQLGGTLTDNTYIDASNKLFAIDGIALATGPASVDAVNGEIVKGSNTAIATGWTLLVRDEATGATQKLKLEDLITSAYDDSLVTTEFITTPAITFESITALPTTPEKIWVYRNGAKLRSGTDYSILTNVITLVPDNAEPNDWELYAGDRIEVYVLSF